MIISLKRLGNYSPLRYPGGKAALAGFLDTVIKASKLHASTYVEPYAGGAGAALSLLFLEKVERIVINDLDPAIYSFWKAATEDTEWFVKRVKEAKLNVREWKKQRDIYRDESLLGTPELGFAVFYLNRTNHSGILDAGPIGGLDQNGRWKIDARFNRHELSERISRIGYYNNRIVVRNEDGLELAREFLTIRKGLLYLDPPYYVKGSSLYLNHFDVKEHTDLSKLLRKFPNSAWVLTYDNVPEIRKLYRAANTFEFSLNYSAHSARVGSEVLIASDKIMKAVNAT